ncbi:MAG: HAD family hydrolase [Candidatus Coatesbacteria bacterium]|nr:HAD family hydrolase [Candidatus Coatesbacteria bacterium]
MKQLAEIDTIIFDMDGTIVLSRDIAIESVRRGAKEMFAELGIDASPPDEARILEGIGKPSPEYFAGLFPELGPSVRAQIQQRIYELEAEILAQGGGKFAPGAPDALVRLRHKGLKLGLGSNCGLGYFESNVNAFRLDEYFDAMLCSGMRGHPGKSAILKELLNTLGAGQAMMVGDRCYDIEAAIQCDMFPVGCVYGYGTRQELEGASVIIANLNELIDILGEKRCCITNS